MMHLLPTSTLGGFGHRTLKPVYSKINIIKFGLLLLISSTLASTTTTMAGGQNVENSDNSTSRDIGRNGSGGLVSTKSPLSQNTYLITGPKIIKPGTDYNLSVQILVPGTVNIKAFVVLKNLEPAPGIEPYRNDADSSETDPPTNFTTLAEGEGTFTNEKIGLLTIKIPEDLSDDFSSRLALHIRTDLRTGQGGTEPEPKIKNETGTGTKFSKGVPIIHPPPSIRNESDLTFNLKTKSFFILTDKAKYKPSDKVQFRIIVVDSYLKPISGGINIYISDSKGNRVKQWIDAQLNTGTFKDLLQLADKAVLGNWRIDAEESKPRSNDSSYNLGTEPSNVQSAVRTFKNFQVEEYTLPTFDLKLTLPPYIILDKEKKLVKVSGYFECKYTFGGYVPGKATINLKDTYGEYVPKLGSVRYDQTELVLSVPGSGRTDFELGINYGDKENYREDSFVYGHTYSLSVTFVDSLTLKTVSETQNIQAYTFPYQLTLIGPPFYKPGLPYGLTIKASQVDGKPLSVQDSKLHGRVTLKKLSSFSKPHYLTNDTYVTEMGKVQNVELDPVSSIGYITFDDTEANVYRLSFEALYPDQPRSYQLSANKFEEPSEIYLELRSGNEKDEPKKVLKVGTEHTIRAKASAPITNLTVLFISRGHLVDLMTIVPNPTPESAEIKFTAGPQLAPNFKILAYFLTPAGNVIADSVDFQIDQITPNSVTLEFSCPDRAGATNDSKNSPKERTGHNSNNSVLAKGTENSSALSGTAPPQVSPGTECKLEVKSAPRSLVGVLGVDKAVRILAQGNDITRDDISNELDSYSNPTGSSDNFYNGGGGFSGESRRRPWRPWNNAGNTYQIFKDAGLVVLTDANLYVGSETIYSRQYAAVGFGGGSPMMDSSPRVQASRQKSRHETSLNIVTRKEFPETWLWEDVETDEQGLGQIVKKVPDTVTTWVATAISLNNETGLGISDTPAELRVFLPFFVALNLPYSVMRGEKVRIQALVYNYLGKDIQAHVELEDLQNEEKSFEILDEFHPIHGNSGGSTTPPAGEGRNLTRFTADQHKVVIKSGEIASIYFYISPLLVGKIKLKVKAETGEAGDAIEKILPVKAEGEPTYFSRSFLVNLMGEGNVTTFKQKFLVPWDIGNMVDGSTHMEVSAIGDIMGPSLSSIGHLVRLPYGCGEQNMLNFAPNLYIYSYLSTKSQLTPSLKSRIRRFTEIGYQRQLTYQREDGSFSAFGSSDKNGSVWLTAFVLRSFVLASRAELDLIYIDPKVIRDCLDFLLHSQIHPEDSEAGLPVEQLIGSFPEMGEVHHKPMQGGASKGLGLTAYVYLALREAKSLERVPDVLDPKTLKRLDKSLSYTEAFLIRAIDSYPGLRSLKPYDLAVVSYALTLAAASDKKSESLQDGRPQGVPVPRVARSAGDSTTTLGATDKVVTSSHVAELSTTPPGTSVGTTEPTKGSASAETTVPSKGFISAVTERIHDIVTHALEASHNNATNHGNASTMEGHVINLSRANDLAFESLMELGKTDANGDFLFWIQSLSESSETSKECSGNTEACIGRKPLSLDFEMTAYALLALTHRGMIDKGLPVLRWLVSHQSNLGGFSSTQDTIVALNAMSKFSSLLPRVRQDLKVTVSGDLTTHDWNINSTNSLVQNIYSFGSTLEKEVSLSAEGNGIALLQVAWSYNLKNASKSSGFKIQAKTRSKNNTLRVEVCLSYGGTTSSRSNMAILEINAPTGYIIDKESVKFKTGKDNHILEAKISELTEAGTKLNLYFDSIGAEEECLNFVMEKLFEVRGYKPSLIKVSDYYQPEYQSTTLIKVPATDLDDDHLD